ncbi:hypothetical protein N8469_00245 [bacterium]|nr:hypothetical protein [bacterium]
MPSTQPFGISCKGGLNTNLNEFEILSSPGLATKLQNYEVDPDGGYRRINGYVAFGSHVSDTFTYSRPGGTTNHDLKGLQVYADGVVACVNDGIFFSNNGIDWLQLNKEDVDANGDTHSTFLTRTAADRTDQQQCTFTVFEGNTDYGELIITEGSNYPFYFKMTGSGALDTRTFYASEIHTDSSHSTNQNHISVKPTVVTSHENYLVMAGDAGNKNKIYISTALSPTNFSGGQAIQLSDQVVGIKSFRDDLIIFCRNSIHKLINIEDVTAEADSTGAIVPITKNVGCLSAYSIQEIGGDLVFLSPDGIRTIAGTARIGDVELSSVSRQVQALVALLAEEVNEYVITSCVIRSKSQYRLFYSRPAETTLDSRGLIGTLTPNGFEWSETIGIKANAITSDFNDEGVEKHYHGDDKGFVYRHDAGNFFHQLNDQNELEEKNIDAIYETPHFDFGELGTRKTLDYVKLSITPEASATVSMNVVYNSHDEETPQPLTYEFPTTSKGGLFGTAKFDVSLFGTGESNIMKAFLQGSGYTASFQILTRNQDSPYSINGLYINYAPSTRR